MGEFTIGTSMSVFVWMVSLGVIIINLYIVGGFLVDEGSSSPTGQGWVYALAGIVAATLYLGFILFLMWQDLVKFKGQVAAMFIKLGGHDSAGAAYTIHSNTAEDILSDGSGRPQQLPTEEDDCYNPLVPGPNHSSSSGVSGADYDPVGRGSDHERKDGVLENSQRGQGGTKLGMPSSPTSDASQSGRLGGDSRA